MEPHLTASSDSLIREAIALQRQDRVAEAIAAYQRILASWPSLPDCWYNLGVLMRRIGRSSDALQCYQRALEAGIAAPEEVHLNRAVILTDVLGQHAQAEQELREALAKHPGYLPALMNLGNLYEDLGRREEAEQTYDRVLALQPGHPDALARRSNLGTGAQRQWIERLRAALAASTATAADRASLGFALGRQLDAAGDYDGAFAAYESANRASRESSRPPAVYDRRAMQAYVDALAIHGVPPHAAGVPADAPRPIIICGMFRSGSTLVEQLLLGCPGVASIGESGFLSGVIARELRPYPSALGNLSQSRLDVIGAAYRAELSRQAPGARFVIDKRPDNFLHLGLIKAALPEARIVHTTRDPLDNCLSIFFLHLDQRMSYALDLGDIGHYYAQYRRLMAFWRERFGPDLHDTNYDELVHSPTEQFQQLCRKLGIVPPEGLPSVPVAGPVKTASVWQVREPLYQRSSGRARHYSRHLARLRSELSLAAEKT